MEADRRKRLRELDVYWETVWKLNCMRCPRWGERVEEESRVEGGSASSVRASNGPIGDWEEGEQKRSGEEIYRMACDSVEDTLLQPQ